MAEDLQIIQGSKAEIYQSLIPQIKSLIDGEPDLIANLDIGGLIVHVVQIVQDPQ